MRTKRLKKFIFAIVISTIFITIYLNNFTLIESIIALELTTKTENNSNFNFDRYIEFNYGNWCGVRNTSSLFTKPIDEVDAVCKTHDLCIGNNDHKCICDAVFLRDMPKAIASSNRGEKYKWAAIEIIERKPCYCQKISRIGIGGKCNF